MRHLPFVLILTCLLLALISLINDGGMGRRKALEENLDRQRAKNEELRGYVQGLKREIYGLEHDSRALEKVAREELGMARPDDLVFFFDDPKKKENKAEVAR